MQEWDAEFIQNRFSEIHARLDALETLQSDQTNLLKRKLDSLGETIEEIKKQRANGSVKIAALGGGIAGAVLEIVQYFFK